MKAGFPRRRGQPLTLLAGVLLLYTGGRALVWDQPFPGSDIASQAIAPLLAEASPRLPTEEIGPKTTAAPFASAPSARGAIQLADRASAADNAASFSHRTAPAMPTGTHRLMAGHALLLAAGLAYVPLPVTVSRSLRLAKVDMASPALTGSSLQQASKEDRWSADGWLFLRGGGASAQLAGVAPASYGASQAGAVLRYKLASASRRDPRAYIRASATLDRPTAPAGMAGAEAPRRDVELAAGLSARPLPDLPVAALAELRVGRGANGTKVRPAGLLVTQFPPIDLPRGVMAEGYGQAGYVGGEFSTPFVDGQTRVTGKVASIGTAQVRAGGGAWGGAQRGAARIDIGPSASVDLRIGAANARAQVDYRIRAAGDAQPGDGIAFTLSTGF